MKPPPEEAWIGRPVRPAQDFHTRVSIIAGVMLGGPADVEFPRMVHPLELPHYLEIDGDTWRRLRCRLESLEDRGPDLGDAVREYIREAFRCITKPDFATALKACTPVIALDTPLWRDARRVVRAIARLLTRVTGVEVQPSPDIAVELRATLYPIAERALVSTLLAQAVAYRIRSLGLRPEYLSAYLDAPSGESPPRELGDVSDLYATLVKDFDGYLARVLRLNRYVTVTAGRRFVLTPDDYDPTWRGYLQGLRRFWGNRGMEEIIRQWGLA
ncbi:hypothetical protein [Methanopyrus kandleri]